MKVLVTCYCLLISISIFSQNITNTLGTNGVFTIKDATNNYLTLDQLTGQVNVLRNLQLENTTSSSLGVLFKGANRFLHNYGAENTFLGINSGNFTMTGVGFNTAVGGFSLNVNTTGYYNSAFGNYSLRSNSAGYKNSAFGYASLYSNDIGYENTAVGYQSLFSNTTGANNTSVGSYSLYSNTTGSGNSALGFQSLYSNTTGLLNTAVGVQSLYSNTTGSDNTAVGLQSLSYNTTGSDNTAVGFNSLGFNTTGNLNTAVGLQSLSYNTTGNSNTSMGFYSLYFNSTGSQNTSVGDHSLQNNNGDFNTALGYNAGSTVTSGYNLTLIGIDANPSTPTTNNEITLGNGFVNTLRCNTQSITSLSDVRDKKNISELNLGIDFLMKIKPRQFNWDKREWYESNVSDGSKMKETPTAGFIAQELDEAQTTQNAEWLNLVLKDNPEKWEATPGNLLPIIVKAIQELRAEKDIEIAKLKSENDELKSNNEKLSAEVESLKSMSEKLAALEQLVNELTSVKQITLVTKN